MHIIALLLLWKPYFHYFEIDRLGLECSETSAKLVVSYFLCEHVQLKEESKLV